jgi:hypothetical protein
MQPRRMSRATRAIAVPEKSKNFDIHPIWDTREC